MVIKFLTTIRTYQLVPINPTHNYIIVPVIAIVNVP
jgi:hypothetical protein